MRHSHTNKKIRLPGTCVFCGSTGITKQHLWPDWMKSIVPRTDNQHHQILTRVSMIEPGTALMQPEIQMKRGPFGARKIRKVCTRCNNGWMSQLETTAKPILTDLILGKETSLNENHQMALSAWTVMTSIIAEYTDQPTLSIPAYHRSHMKDGNSPPEGWYIWIGAYSGDRWKQRYRHHGMACVPNSTIKPIHIKFNTQSSTFVIGSLLIYASSTTSPNLMPIFNSNLKDNLVQIWPTVKSNIEWPTTLVLSDNDADEISDVLRNQLPMWGTNI